MIIEAGYDLQQLIGPELFADEASRGSLWVMAMDEDLRFLFTRKVRDEVPGSLEDAVPELVAVLDGAPLEPHYFVLAHMVPSMGPDIADEVHREDERIHSAVALAKYELLGRLVFDDEYVYSSAPRYSFRDYVGCENLPRAAVIPGPHEFLSCACLACAQHEAKLERARSRYTAAHLRNDPAV